MTAKEIFDLMFLLLFGLVCGVIARSDGYRRADADWLAIMPGIEQNMKMTGWFQCQAGKSEGLSRVIDLNECKRKRTCA